MLAGWQRKPARPLQLPTSSNEVLTRYQGQITGTLQTLPPRLLQFFAGSVSKLAWMAIIPIVTFYLLQEIDPRRPRRHLVRLPIVPVSWS